MSATTETRRLTAVDILRRKAAEPIVALTAYDVLAARIADEVCDVLLVGDSLGMVVYGLDSTVPVSLDVMREHRYPPPLLELNILGDARRVCRAQGHQELRC